MICSIFQIPAQKYKIFLKTNRVYDITERKVSYSPCCYFSIVVIDYTSGDDNNINLYSAIQLIFHSALQFINANLN